MLTSFLKKLTGGKFLFLIIAVCLLLNVKLNAQEIEWQNTIGGSGYDEATSIQQTVDGGFIFAGYSNSNISGKKNENTNGGGDYWIVKTDPLGNIQWQNSIGGSGDDILKCIQQTFDGGFILGGYSNSFISGDKTEGCVGGMDYWIVKIDSIGNILWQNVIGGSGSDFLFSLQQTNDGGYILGGNSCSYVSGDKTEDLIDISVGNWGDYWIVKTDSIGSIVWQNTIGSNDQDVFSNIQQTSDGGYIIGGYSNSGIYADKTENSLGTYDYWIVKTDASGNVLWNNTIGGNCYDEIGCIQQTTDNGYILSGRSCTDISGDKTVPSQGDHDNWVLKLGTSGNIEWQKSIGGSIFDDLNSIVRQTSDGGFIIGGFSNSNISGNKTENSIGSYDYWIVKTDTSGNVEWDNTIGGTNLDVIYDIQQTPDGGYVVAGFSNSDSSGNKSENSFGLSDFWILKINNNYKAISGKVFIDANSNGIKDLAEFNLTNSKIIEINTGNYAFSHQSGNYSIILSDTGSFTVQPTTRPYYSATPSIHSASFAGTSLPVDNYNDFAFQPTGVFNDLCVSITPLNAIRPGFNSSYLINYENIGTTFLNSSLKLFPDSIFTYVSSSITPSVISSDSIVWSIGAIYPYQYPTGNIVVTFSVSTSAPLGFGSNSIVQIEPIINDANPVCNIDTATVTITGSYDPNDILVSEDTLTTIQLAAQPFLDYTIRFQNTGNDTAFTVKIINHIDTNKLDISSIEFLNSSHLVNLKWYKVELSMEFLFENILLPDSNINEPQSHGFVKYRIKPKTTLLAGDSVTNKAYIYFDFNAPVETNTAVTKIILPTSINELAKASGQLAIFPNPAKDELNIQLNNSKANNLITVYIFDVLGNIVLSKQSATANLPAGQAGCKLPTANLSKGIYFVEVKTGKEVYRGKFVKSDGR